MLFLSRQEVVSIMNEYKEECDKRISRIEEEQKETTALIAVVHGHIAVHGTGSNILTGFSKRTAWDI